MKKLYANLQLASKKAHLAGGIFGDSQPTNFPMTDDPWEWKGEPKGMVLYDLLRGHPRSLENNDLKLKLSHNAIVYHP